MRINIQSSLNTVYVQMGKEGLKRGGKLRFGRVEERQCSRVQRGETGEKTEMA